MNIFIIRTYSKAWFNTPCPEKAPKQDLDLLCELVNDEKSQPEISKATSEKFAGHLWYLSDEFVGLALSYDQVEQGTKELMLKAMQTRTEDQDDATKRIQIRPINSVLNLMLDKLVTSYSKRLLDKLGVSDLLNVPVSSWNHSEEYKTMKSKFSNIP